MGVYLAIMLFFGLAGGYIGRLKGSSFFLWFLISALLPFVGVLVAALQRSERDEPRRRCPGCGRVVKLYEALCTGCGTELEYTEEQLPPESALAAR